MTAGTAVAGDRRPWSRQTIYLLVMTVGVPAVLLLLWKLLPMTEYMREAIDWVDSTGYLGIAGFMALYTVAAMLGIPRTPLHIAAGVIFSYTVALIVVMTGAALAYTTTFWIARHVARDWVKKQVQESEKVQRLLELCDQEAFKAVCLIRMNLLIPGVLKGYGFGTTNIPYKTYISASLLGFLPIALVHVYLGWAGGEAVIADGSMSDLEKWLVIGGVVLSVALVAGIYWYGKHALNKHYTHGESK